MTMPTPSLVNHYLAAANRGDFSALADCFTPDGTVLDEGHTYRGREAIIGWREAIAGKWTYTSTVTSSQPINAQEFRVTVRVEGDFPGAVADLTYKFSIRDGLIADLSIVE
jgi:uncharacterized protein (TIGR02246 family)